MAPFLLTRAPGKGMLFAFDEFVLDTRAFELSHRGARVPLQKRPLDLLTYLVLHRDRVVTKAEILTEVWGGVRVTENALVQAVANVRAALGNPGAHAIRSVRGRGYRFVLPAVVLAEASTPALEPPASIRVTARPGEALGTFRAVLRAYVDARPDASIDGLPLAKWIGRARTDVELVALAFALFADVRQEPGAVVIEQLDRADLESLLLYAALAARPPQSLVIRATCLCTDGLAAQLLGTRMVTTEFAA